MKAKEQRFCEEYVVDFNGTQAAIRAGYSKKTAGQIATEYLKKPHIAAYVADLQEELRNKTGLSAELVIEELRSLGFGPSKILSILAIQLLIFPSFQSKNFDL
jgi:phage terminase small subunit